MAATTTSEPAPSTANAPDLNWSQVPETVRMLHLAVAQIAMAMQGGEDSLDALSRSFTRMAENVGAISELVQTSGRWNDHEAAESEILGDCVDVQSGMQQSIVAFQFHDHLSQRLTLVNQVLSGLAELVFDPARFFSPVEWTAMQDITVRAIPWPRSN